VPPTPLPSVEPAPAPEAPSTASVWRILKDVARVLAVAAAVYLLAVWFQPWPQLASVLGLPNPWALADLALVLLAALIYYLVAASRRSAELTRALQRAHIAEAQVADERARLYGVLDNLPSLVFVLNPDYTFGFVNREFRRVLGEPDGRRCYEWLHGQASACESCVEWQLADEGAQRDAVLWEIRGRKYAVTNHSVPLGDGFQRLHVAVDITERQQAEEAVRRAEERLRLAQQVARMGSWSLDIQSGRVRFSPEIGAMLGVELNAESYPTTHLADLLQPQDRAHIETRLQEANQGILHEMESQQRVTLPDGSQRTLYSRQMAIHDEAGALVEILGTTQDVTERVELEERLRRSRDLLEATQEIGQLGGWEYTVATGEMVVTEAMRQIHDDHITNISLTRGFAFYVEEDRASVERAFWRAVRQGEPYDLEARVITTAGRRRWMRTIGKPVTENGQVVRVTGVRMDITERKEAEQQREALIQDLRAALARVRRLSGLLPICSVCKRIRSDEGYWEDVAAYISEHSEVEFSHGICPTCLVKLNPDAALQSLGEEPPAPEQ
jgi:PAS domain S-box-containing protein